MVRTGVGALKSHGLLILWWAGDGISFPSSLTDHDGYDVNKEEYAGDDTIDDWSVRRIVRELESEAAVDDTKCDNDSAKPDMAVGESGSCLELLEVGMMEETEDWLDEEQDEENYANDRMGIVDLSTD